MDKTQELIDAVKGLTDAVKATPAPAVEQSNAAAINTEAVNARERANAAGITEEQRKSIVSELAEKMAAFRELEKARETATRHSEYSLSDATNVIADSLQISPETKGVFGSLGRRMASDSKGFRAMFGDRSPLDVIVRGALVPTRDGDGIKPFTVGATDELLREFQDLNDACFYWLVGKKMGSVGVVEPASCPKWGALQRAYRALCKALDTTDTANFVPTGFSSALIERYELERNLVKYIKGIQIPRSPFLYPVMSTRTSVYKIAEQTADPESATAVTTSDLVDAAVTFTLTSMGVRTSWSQELDEDSIVTIATAARSEMAKAWAYSEEDVILNGDTTGTHQDTDVTASTDVRKTFKGFRKHALANSYSTNVNASAPTAETFKNLIKSMGRYGHSAQNTAFVFGPTIAAELLTLKDANNNPVMIGTAAAVTTPAVQTIGAVPMIFGRPAIVSEAFREDLNATGVYDATTTDTGIIAFNREAWGYAYVSEAPTIDAQKWIRTGQYEVVMRTRRDFQPLYAIASNKCVWFGYNIAV